MRKLRFHKCWLSVNLVGAQGSSFQRKDIMCCFSQPVISVRGTNIFARPDADGRQLLVYSMTINARNDLAMILPLPVKTPAGEKDVKFVDLKEYPEFFADMEVGFQPPPPRMSRGLATGSASAAPPKLEVVQVGNFEAS